MSDREKIRQNVTLIIEKAASSASYADDMNQVNSLLDEAERKSIKLVDKPDEIIDIQRVILGWKIRLFCDSKLDFSTVNKLRAGLLMLGYSSLDFESSTETYFANYCLKVDQRSVAVDVLTKLLPKLLKYDEKNKSGGCRRMIKYAEELLDKAKDE